MKADLRDRSQGAILILVVLIRDSNWKEVDTMERTPLDSSWLLGVDAEVKGDKVDLILHKDNGKALVYEGLPTSVLTELKKADSPGTYYREHIMDAYEPQYKGTEVSTWNVA